MRRIFKGLLATAVVVFLTGYGISKSMNNNAQLSATTLANIEAISQDENGGGNGVDCGNENWTDHILTLKNCSPFFWLQKLKCMPMSGKCCVSDNQKSCSGQNPGFSFGI